LSISFWDRHAEKYAQRKIANPDAYQVKLERTRHYFTPESVVLEFGCGTGSTALLHAPSVKKIVATDVSKKMIDIARGKLEKEGLDNVEFRQATLEDLDDPPGSYDAVLGLNILHLLPDMEGAIQKSYELLKPGGVFVTSTVCCKEVTGMAGVFLKLIVPIGGAFGFFPHLNKFGSDTLEQSITGAGFTILENLTPGDEYVRFIIAQK